MKFLPLFTIVGLITACGSEKNYEADREQSSPPSLFDAQTQALDKAKNVEKSLQDAESARRKAMEEQERQ